MSRLSLFLLGPPQFELDYLPLEFNNRKVIALLAYLAVTHQACSRDSLATLLWPESDQAKARAGLRNTIWTVNKLAGLDWLVVERETVALAETGDLWLDIEQFARHLAACRGHGHLENEVCPECLPLLAEAVQLYRGDFLGSFSLRDSSEFDQWQFFQRERLRRELGSALERMTRGQTAQGQFEAAIHSAWRWLELDNLNETVHRQLMRLYGWSGQPAAALRQYQECAKLLQAAFGASPSAATIELYEAIKAGHLPEPPARLSTGSLRQAQGTAGALTPLPSSAPIPSVLSVPPTPSPTPEQWKQVTVVSVDLAEFTTLAEAIAPEEMGKLVEMLWRRFETITIDYEGHLNRYQGEAILTLFGPPQAREDDPERAIRVALAFQAESRRFALEMGLLQGDEALLRVGIDTGPVLLKLMESQRDYSVVGRPFSLAGQLRQIAPVGDILITRYTSRHVQGLFELEPFTGFATKRGTEPVQLYRVRQARPRTFRMPNRGIEGVKTRMIGREVELRQLEDIWETVLEDHECQVVTLIGEAGIGKSRLLDEFYARLVSASKEMKLFRGRADPQMSRRPYALIRDLLVAFFEIRDSDPPIVVTEKLERGVAAIMGPAGVEKVSFIGHMLEFDSSGSLSQRDGSHQRRDQAFQYVAQLFTLLAKNSPIVIFLEDLHWADNSSLDLIAYLARSCRRLPLLIIGLARPSFREQRPLWGEGQSFYTRLELSALSRRNSRRLVEEILRRIPEIPPDLRNLIVNGAEGSPFYIEELIKTLIENDVIVTGPEWWKVELQRLAEVDAPPTLVGVFQARLDRLPLPARETLQWAAVVGRVFWDKALVYLQSSGAPAPMISLIEVLTLLQRKEMIFARSTLTVAGAQEYTFKHAILHEVAYNSTLKRIRPQLHVQVAHWLEAQGREQVEAYAGLIGEHYERAGELIQALLWYQRAGRQAQQSYANETTILWYTRLLELLAQLHPDELLQYRELQSMSRVALGETFTLVGRFDEALEQYIRALAELEAHPQEEHLPAGLYRRVAEVHELRSEYEVALQWLGRGLSHLNKVEPNLEAAHLYRLRAWIQFHQGKYDEALEGFQQSLTLASTFNTPEGQRAIAEAYHCLSAVYSRWKEIHLAEQACLKGLKIYQSLGDIAGQAHSYHNLAMVYYRQGDWTHANHTWHKSLAIKQEIGHILEQAHLINNLAVIHLEQGEWDQAVELLQESLAIARQLGAQVQEGLALSNLAQVHLHRGNWAEAEACLSQSRARFSQSGSEEHVPELERRWGEFYLKSGDLDQALAHLQRSIELAVSQQVLLDEGMTYRILGQLHLVGGELELAQEALDRSLTILKPLNKHETARTQVVLARLALAGGALAEAGAYLAEAIPIFEKFGAQADLAEAWRLAEGL